MDSSVMSRQLHSGGSSNLLAPKKDPAHSSFRGAKRRGNLIVEVHRYEIATSRPYADSGPLLAMTGHRGSVRSCFLHPITGPAGLTLPKIIPAGNPVPVSRSPRASHPRSPRGSGRRPYVREWMSVCYWLHLPRGSCTCPNEWPG